MEIGRRHEPEGRHRLTRQRAHIKGRRPWRRGGICIRKIRGAAASEQRCCKCQDRPVNAPRRGTCNHQGPGYHSCRSEAGFRGGKASRPGSTGVPSMRSSAHRDEVKLGRESMYAATGTMGSGPAMLGLSGGALAEILETLLSRAKHSATSCRAPI